MKIITVYFNSKYLMTQDKESNTVIPVDYNKMAACFEASCRIVAPKIEFHGIRLPNPPITESQSNIRRIQEEFGYKYHTKERIRLIEIADGANTLKLEEWNRWAQKATEPLIFADADMIMLKDPTNMIPDDFDIGWTKRTNFGGFLLNGGIILFNPTDRAKLFFQKWVNVNRYMYAYNKDFHFAWRKKYAGMNQASFGCLYEKNLETQFCNLKSFPCATWNACAEDWQTVSPCTTYFVHIKSALRRVCFGCEELTDKTAAPYYYWNEFAKYSKIMGLWPENDGIPEPKMPKIQLVKPKQTTKAPPSEEDIKLIEQEVKEKILNKPTTPPRGWSRGWGR